MNASKTFGAVPSTGDHEIPQITHGVYTLVARPNEVGDLDISIQEGMRPFDWGSPAWSYFCFGIQTFSPLRVRYCHCWTVLNRTEEELLNLFVSKVATSAYVHEDPTTCGTAFLADGDVWEDSWGSPPPSAQSFFRQLERAPKIVFSEDPGNSQVMDLYLASADLDCPEVPAEN